jgi:hypothetical protein
MRSGSVVVDISGSVCSLSRSTASIDTSVCSEVCRCSSTVGSMLGKSSLTEFVVVTSASVSVVVQASVSSTELVVVVSGSSISTHSFSTIASGSIVLRSTSVVHSVEVSPSS